MDINLNLQNLVNTFIPDGTTKSIKGKGSNGAIPQKKNGQNMQTRDGKGKISRDLKAKSMDNSRDCLMSGVNMNGIEGDKYVDESLQNIGSTNSLNENEIASFSLNDMNNLNLLFNSLNQNMTSLSNVQEDVMDKDQLKDLCNENLPPI